MIFFLNRFPAIRGIFNLVLVFIVTGNGARPLAHIAKEANGNEQADKSERDPAERFDGLDAIDPTEDDKDNSDNSKDDAPEKFQINWSFRIFIGTMHGHTGKGNSHGVTLRNKRYRNDHKHDDFSNDTHGQHIKHGKSQCFSPLGLIDTVEIKSIEKLSMKNRAAKNSKPNNPKKGGQEPFNNNELAKGSSISNTNHKKAGV